MRKRLNDKGSALVTVIVACAVIGLLAVVSLWASLINYQMKITDTKVKSNFYSAESVLDQICVGLQSNVSDAYNKAYTTTMQKYSALSEDERNNMFIREYVENICLALKSTTVGDRNYNMSLLKSYVDSNLLDTTTYPYVEITSLTASDDSGDGLMSTYDSGVVLKGIKVVFVDEEGFSSVIETDISLNIPEMKFVTAEDMPDTFSYSMIANSGIDFTEPGSNVNVNGSVYAGSPYAVSVSNPEVMSFNLKDIGIKLTLADSKYLIAEGTINISDSSVFSVAADNQLWTDNIQVGGGTDVHLRGSSYVSDDLTLGGNSPKVYLGEGGTGRYVGYGNNTNRAADSSAIIINGKNSTLDMSGLDDLFVAGYSFIQTSSIANDHAVSYEDNNDVRMGESISLKGNQIGYLIPGECIGVDSSGKSLYNRNPITYAEYSAIMEDDDYTEVDDSIVSHKTGHKLSYYLENGESISDCVTTVFVPTNSGQESDGLVYYYISLSPETASLYYNDYYSENTEKLNTYADFFANVINSNDAASRVYTAGKFSLYESDELKLYGTNELDVDDEIALLENTYTALNSTLTANYQSGNGAAYGQTVFENIIDSAKLLEVTNGQPSGKRKVNFTGSAGDVMTAVLVNGDYTYSSETQEGGNLRLIIATGDVNVNADFTGTIICLGKLSVNGNCNIKNEDQEKMKKLLTADIDGTNFLYHIFDEGSSYIVSLTGGNGDASNTSIAYSDIITFKNWTKK
ncbi:MAG: hypothetical protein SOZ81_05130 [Agathobacter sp.]|nr:hypothetical protein [Agathobacter sp.]